MASHSRILAWRIPMDRGAWQATVCGVAKSRSQWKQLDMHIRNLSLGATDNARGGKEGCSGRAHCTWMSGGWKCPGPSEVGLERVSRLSSACGAGSPEGFIDR